MQPRAATTHEGDALVALFERALPEVYHYLLHRCRRRAVAEDLTSETFLAAVAAIRRGAVDEPSTGWLIGIARTSWSITGAGANGRERRLQRGRQPTGGG